METSKCPTCQSDIVIDDEAFVGDLVDCQNCGTQLEITSLRPTLLAKIENQNEDDFEDEADDGLDDY